MLLLILGAIVLSDLRKWLAAGKACLVIYEKGFTYQDKTALSTCGWNEIKHIDFKPMAVKTRSSIPKTVNVIRSIVKTDGTVITLTETLNLKKITGLVLQSRQQGTGR